MRNPLDDMRIRREAPNNSFGLVRNQGHRPHQGWDLAADVYTRVYAVASGTIVDVREQGDYGRQVTLMFEHGFQTLYAFYAHLSFVFCTMGQNVREGDVIAYTGRTGNAGHLPAADNHLHFEIRTEPRPGRGLGGRLDPGTVFGFDVYSCRP